MSIHFTSNNFELEDKSIWVSEPTDILPNGIKRIQLNTTGDVLIWGSRLNCFSTKHFVQNTPFLVPSELIRPYHEKEDQAGRFIGELGEQRTRDILLSNGADPHNILMPLQVLTSTGHKEISDGIILSGSHAFILQVKTTMTPDKAWNETTYRRKLYSLKHLAYKQGIASYDLLKEHQVLEFQTSAGNSRVITTSEYTWSVISIISFSDAPLIKPARVFMQDNLYAKEIPNVVFSLKEWEDLFNLLTFDEAIKTLHYQTKNLSRQYFGWQLLYLFSLVNSGVVNFKNKT